MPHLTNVGKDLGVHWSTRLGGGHAHVGRESRGARRSATGRGGERRGEVVSDGARW